MRTPKLAALAALILLPTLVSAQHNAGNGLNTAPPREASQFDFVVGEWELTVRPAISALAARMHGVPRMLGTLRATRAMDGFGVQDELRITDDAGNPQALTQSVRFYDARQRRWEISSLDVYRGAFMRSTATWTDGKMVVSGSGTDPQGRAYLSRSTYVDISATGFTIEQERSLDNGAKWEKTLTIQAKRVATKTQR